VEGEFSEDERVGERRIFVELAAVSIMCPKGS
jgi:hypothetical protein